MYAVSTYGVPPNGPSCNDIGVCKADGVSTDWGCYECALLGGQNGEYDGGDCAGAYADGLGIEGNCADGVPELCELIDCLDACEAAAPDQSWVCVCGSADEPSCDYTRAPAGTCLGDNPTGAEWMYGLNGWMTCVRSTCYSACG
jgi:hypothetical protein